MAMTSVSSVSRSDARMVIERSEAKVMSRPAGSAAWSLGIELRTSSTVEMMFAPGWRNTTTSTDGLPSARPRFLTSWILDVGDVLQPQRVAVAVGHDQVSIIGRVIGLIVGIDLPALRADIDRALRRVRGADVLEPDAVMEESQRIELDAHG